MTARHSPASTNNFPAVVSPTLLHKHSPMWVPPSPSCPTPPWSGGAKEPINHYHIPLWVPPHRDQVEQRTNQPLPHTFRASIAASYSARPRLNLRFTSCIVCASLTCGHRDEQFHTGGHTSGEVQKLALLRCNKEPFQMFMLNYHTEKPEDICSPKMKDANWLKLICHQGRSLMNIFSLWNIWYKSVILSLIWLHSLVCQIHNKQMSQLVANGSNICVWVDSCNDDDEVMLNVLRCQLTY